MSTNWARKHFLMYLLLVALAGILILAGYRLYARPVDFTLNLFAEAAGILVSVLVAVTLAERLIRQSRESQWERIRDITLRAIANHIARINAYFLGICMFTHGDDKAWENADKYAQQLVMPLSINMELVEIIRKSAGLIKTYVESHMVAQMHFSQSSVNTVKEVFENTKWQFDPLCDVLIPRVFEISTDTGLIEVLTQLEDSYRRWQGAMIPDKVLRLEYFTVEFDPASITPHLALKTLDAAALVYTFIAEKYYKN